MRTRTGAEGRTVFLLVQEENDLDATGTQAIGMDYGYVGCYCGSEIC